MTVITSAYLGSWDVATIAQPVSYEFDKTNSQVADAFVSDMQVIYNVFAKPTGTAITATDVTNVQAALAHLKQLATGTAGAIQNPDGSLQIYFLTVEMVQSLDLIIRSFQAVGSSDPATNLTLDQLNRWKDFSMLSPTIQNALFDALNATKTNRSIQSLVELDYVSAGNDLIADKLGGLESAITLTKDILSLMTQIQDAKTNGVVLHARTDLSAPVPFDKTFSNLTSTQEANFFQSFYTQYNSAYYTGMVFPLPNDDLFTAYTHHWGASYTLPIFTGLSLILGGFKPNLKTLESSVVLDNDTLMTSAGYSLYKQLFSYRQQMSVFKTQLSTQFPDQVADANSLYSTVTKVYNHLAEAFPNATNSRANAVHLFAWLADRENIGNSSSAYTLTGAKTGDVQDAMTTAITAAESLNDTQKENVRNFLFVFEEFYKSASAVLQRISAMIEKMASNISR